MRYHDDDDDDVVESGCVVSLSSFSSFSSLCLCRRLSVLVFVLAVHGRDHVPTTTSSCLRQETADPFGGCPEGGGRERGEARQSVVSLVVALYF